MTVVEEYEVYLNQELEKFKQDLDTKLENYKKVLNLEVNLFMQDHINYALKRVEVERDKHVRIFKSRIDYVRLYRNNNPNLKTICDRMEDSAKQQLSHSLRLSFNVWFSFIEQCKKEMK